MPAVSTGGASYTAPKKKVAAALGGGPIAPGNISGIAPGNLPGVAIAPPPAPSGAVGSPSTSPVASKLGYDPASTTNQDPTNPYLTNPGYLAAISAEQTGSQQADASLRAAQEAAIVGYGDPSLAAALGLSVDPNTAAAARANYLAGNSTLARLDRQHGLNQQASINNLAAHGILYSGETGYQRGQIDTNYGNNVYDAQQALLNQNQQWESQNVATKQGLHQGVIDALTGAYNAYIANPADYGQAQPPPAAAPPAAAPAAAAAPTAPAPAASTVAANLAKSAASRLAKRPISGYAQASRANLH